MEIEVWNADEVSFMTVAGDVDLETAPALRLRAEATLAEPTRTLRIDVSGVSFIDSSGLGALVAIRTQAAAEQKTLILDRPTSQTLRLLELSGLGDVFNVGD